jgi:hypothetical protein
MGITPHPTGRGRVREPHLLGFILLATLVIVAGVVSIGETDDAWLVALVVGVMLALAGALALDVGAAIDADEEARPAAVPEGGGPETVDLETRKPA